MIVRVPDTVPVVAGLKVTVMVHAWPGARMLPAQLSVSEYPPLAVIVLTVTFDKPLLVKVTVCPVLGVFRGSLPNASVDGETETDEEPPTPARAMVCGLLLASSVMVSEPVRVPETEGVK